MGSGCSTASSAAPKEARVVPLASGATGDDRGALKEGGGGGGGEWARKSGRSLHDGGAAEGSGGARGEASRRATAPLKPSTSCVSTPSHPRVRSLTGVSGRTVGSMGVAAGGGACLLAVTAEERIDRESGGGASEEAASAYRRHRKRGPVRKEQVTAEMRALYESRGLAFDDDGVDYWIRHTLEGMGRGAGLEVDNEGLSLDEFALLHSCCKVFAENKLVSMRRASEAVAAAVVPAMAAAGSGGDAAPEQYAKNVFLGGSCNPTTWRRDIAVPLLERHGVTYYNPQTDHWHPGLIEEEARAKEHSDDLLFVIDSVTRSIASMLEAVEYVTRGRRVLLVILELEEGVEVDGEAVVGRQCKDLNRARLFLADVASRHPHNAFIFGTVEEALADAARRHGREHAHGAGGRRFSQPAPLE